MKPENDADPSWTGIRARIIGLGENSAKKSYYAELQKRLDELRASEADLRTVFNSTHDAIIIHDFEGRVQDVNDSMLALYRVTHEEALRFTVLDYSAPGSSSGDKLADIYGRLAAGNGDLVFEWPAFRPTEKTAFDAEVALRPVVWKNRKMIVAVVRDISERKRAEQERLHLEEQLAHARKMESIGQLAGGVAHDFNNMLSPILSYAVMLRDDLPAGNPMRADLEEIIRSAQRARDLTRQLLAFARKQTLSLRPLNLNDVVSGFNRILSRTLRENITLTLRLAPRLGTVLGDAGQLEQVLLNLALNAQDAMPDGGLLELETWVESRTAEAGISSAGSFACLAVRDSGTGIRPEIRAKIFDPFFTTKELGRGTGLGLSTVDGIVRQHGGTIELESEVGKGSRFIVRLPSEDSFAPAPEQSSVGGLGELAEASSKTVLLVEDQPAVLLSTQKLLERLGFFVIAASSASEALERAQVYTGEMTLLVTDVVMKGMNGRELYDGLKRLRPSLKVVFISGYPADVIGRHGVLDKGTFFLQKPFTKDELSEKIAEALK